MGFFPEGFQFWTRGQTSRGLCWMPATTKSRYVASLAATGWSSWSERTA